jgi:membrane protease YdiL (CAAX protease family)
MEPLRAVIIMTEDIKKQPSPAYDLLLVYLPAVVIISVLKNTGLGAPFARLLPVIAAAVFTALPIGMILLREERLSDYGIRLIPDKKGTAFLLISAAVIFPIFVVGYHFYQHLFFSRGLKAALPAGFFALAIAHLVIVAIPEEILYRGYILKKLAMVLPKGPSLLGVAGWPSITAASVLFALGHMAVDPRPMRLGVFFPSLLFGWMKIRTGSTAVPIIFHALSNVIMAALEKSYLG